MLNLIFILKSLSMIGFTRSSLIKSITKLNKFRFSQIEKAAAKLQSIIDEQIKARRNQLNQEQLKKISQQLHKKKWKVNCRDAFIEIQKQGLTNYEVKTRVKVRAGDYKKDEPKYLQTNVFVNRANSKNMMVAKLVSEGKKFDIVDFKINKAEYSESQLKLCSELDDLRVLGSNLQMIDHKIAEGIFLFLLSFGFDPDFFQNLKKIHENYEKKLYIQWLEDLRNLT